MTALDDARAAWQAFGDGPLRKASARLNKLHNAREDANHERKRELPDLTDPAWPAAYAAMAPFRTWYARLDRAHTEALREFHEAKAENERLGDAVRVLEVQDEDDPLFVRSLPPYLRRTTPSPPPPSRPDGVGMADRPDGTHVMVAARVADSRDIIGNAHKGTLEPAGAMTYAPEVQRPSQ